MSKDPFDLLGIKAEFEVDAKTIDERQRALSAELHPDKNSAQGSASRRAALGLSIEVNEAARLLKNPVSRAEALLRRGGQELGEQSWPAAPPQLLMRIMELREALSAARQSEDEDAVEALIEKVRVEERQTLDELKLALAAEPQDAEAAMPCVVRLKYYARFFEEAAAILDDLMI